MPSGTVHNAVTLGATVTVIAGSAIIGAPYEVIMGELVGGLVGLVLTPDLDVDHGNRSDTIIRAIFPPLAYIWDAGWYGYRKLFRHRGRSHVPIVGTLTRVLWPLMLPFTVLFVWLTPWPMWLAAFGMLCVADTLHKVADTLVSDIKHEMRY